MRTAPYAPSVLARPILALGVLALLLCIILPRARAQGPDDVNVCICKHVLARTLCKDPADFALVTRLAGSPTYYFNVFYANQDTGFYCRVGQSSIAIKGKAGRAMTRTMTYQYDDGAMCATTDYSVPECAYDQNATCCHDKAMTEIQAQKVEDFWDRPIPDILRDELESNATDRVSEEEAAMPGMQ